MNPIIVNPKLAAATAALYYQVIHDHLEAFALTLEDLREPAKVEPFSINTFGPPCSKQPIRLPPAHAKFVRDEFAALKDVGLVRNQATPWAAPVFPVPKPRSDKLRLVNDFRGLNLQTIRDSFPIPHIKDVVMKVGAWTAWFKLDLKSGFW